MRAAPLAPEACDRAPSGRSRASYHEKSVDATEGRPHPERFFSALQ